MIHDPEREQALQDRLAQLIGDAPAPDSVRLREALFEAQSRAARRRRGRRALAWLAAACLLGAGTATAWWFDDPRKTQSEPEPAGEAVDGRDNPPARSDNARERPEVSATPEDGKSGEQDSRIIYQRAD